MELLDSDEFELLRGDSSPSAPLNVSWAMGNAQPGDIFWTTWAVPMVFGNRALSLLKENGFTGWSTYPVEVRNKDGEVVDGYAGFSVTGRCGCIDNSRSEKVDREFPGGIFPVYRGLYFDESRWDGADIFCSEDKTGYVFVTTEVKLAFQKAKISNVRFELVAEIERSTL